MAEVTRRARQGFSRYECIGRVIRTRLQKTNGKTAVLWFDVILSNIEGTQENRTEVPFVARCKCFGNQAEFLGERWKNVGDDGAPKPRVHVKDSRPTFDPPKQVTDAQGRTYNTRDVTYIVPPFGLDFLDAAPNNGTTEAPAPAEAQTDAPAEQPAPADGEEIPF